MKHEFIAPSRMFNDSKKIAELIINDYSDEAGYTVHIAGVPRGGVPVVYMVVAHLSQLDSTRIWSIEDSIEGADVIVDDIIDSGITKQRVMEINPSAKFYSVYQGGSNDKPYLDFPWEVNPHGDSEDSICDNYRRILQFYGKEVTGTNVNIITSIMKDTLDALK